MRFDWSTSSAQLALRHRILYVCTQVWPRALHSQRKVHSLSARIAGLLWKINTAKHRRLVFFRQDYLSTAVHCRLFAERDIFVENLAGSEPTFG